MAWTVTERGAAVREFLTGLPSTERADALAVIGKLRDYGTALRAPHSKPLGKGLFELRTDAGVRIFYGYLPGYRAVLLGGIWKKRQDVPPAVVRRMRQELAQARDDDRTRGP